MKASMGGVGFPPSLDIFVFAAINQSVNQLAGEAEGRRSRSMRFLVTIDGSDIGVGMPPERLAQVVEHMVTPGLEQLVQWEQEGRIYGGGYTAARGGVFIMEADSSEEVDQLVTSLPHWGLVKVEVKPLISTSEMVERSRAMSQRLQERVG